MTKAISILGTGSDVGKSIVATAFCRILKNKGINVAPFKAQNMSNNSFVTIDGGEMGRAQVVQAEAAQTIPHPDMNPILLKPSADNTSQIILQGKPIGNKNSREYWGNTDFLFDRAITSFNRLSKKYDFIVIEGAGSCAEINLQKSDFVNFRMAHKANANVILVADIDRGGVFAQIIGTLNIIPPEDRERVKGIIINKFRGDASLFNDGIKYLEKETGLPILGLIPYYRNIDIDSEDGVILEANLKTTPTFINEQIKIGVLKLPHISNFTDIAPLQRDASVSLSYLYKPRVLSNFDLIIIPGTKNTRFDLEWLRQIGWENILKSYAKKGGNIIGICGGFQMLGKTISDPLGIEGMSGTTRGLGLLDVETTLSNKKHLAQIIGKELDTNTKVKGYEIHNGVTNIGKNCNHVFNIETKNGEKLNYFDGAKNNSGNVWGTYVHGLFDEVELKRTILQQIKPMAKLNNYSDKMDITEFKNMQYNLLAKHFQKYLNMNLVDKIFGISK